MEPFFYSVESHQKNGPFSGVSSGLVQPKPRRYPIGLMAGSGKWLGG